ncbi:MAG TPA: hypothetical protein DEQ56_02200 [Bacteroidetes bacterium]|jgi:hypothetical protein|nr:hypothetical protein [Bacteroidota bacterium]
MANISSFGQYSYSKNLNAGLIAATNGFGINISTSLSSVTSNYQNCLSLDFQTLQTVNETKVQNQFTTNPKSFVLGKVNSAGALRIGYSISKRLGNYLPNKQNLFLGACFGPSIGILKPYYIGYLDPKSEDRQALIIVQNEETLQNQADIYGPANWTRGLYELTYKLGLHFDVNLSTNKNDLYLLQKWTTGARLDLFPQGLNVLYKTETQSFFSIYLSYKLGSNP